MNDYAPDSYERACAAAPVDRVQGGYAAASLRFERDIMSANEDETTDGYVPGRPRLSDRTSGRESEADGWRAAVTDGQTVQNYQREMMCVIDADFVDNRQARPADVADGYAPVRRPVTTGRRVSFGTDVTPDYEQRWQMSNRLARSLDGGPRRGRLPDHTAQREMADTLALPLRRVLVYVDPQTDLSSPQRRKCRMTLSSYEKVMDAQTSATKAKRTNRAVKRLSFLDGKKPNTADGIFTESRPTVCVDQNMSDNDEGENAGCTAVLCDEVPPYVKLRVHRHVLRGARHVMVPTTTAADRRRLDGCCAVTPMNWRGRLPVAVIVVTSRRRHQSAPASTLVSVYNVFVIKSNTNMHATNVTKRLTLTMPP